MIDWLKNMKRNPNDVGVQYVNYPRGEQCCDRCNMYRPPSSCTAIKSSIIAKGHCFLFEPKKRD